MTRSSFSFFNSSKVSICFVPSTSIGEIVYTVDFFAKSFFVTSFAAGCGAKW